MQSSFFSRLHLDRLMEQGFQTIMVTKPRISFENRGKVLALLEEGYSQSQGGSPGVCTISQGLDSWVQVSYALEWWKSVCQEELWKIASNQQWNMEVGSWCVDALMQKVLAFSPRWREGWMGKVTSINYHLLTTTSGWIFQQDNATCHTSRLVRE